MNEIDQAFVQKYCRCGGKIHIFLLEGRGNYGDRGDEVIITQMHERCTGVCGRIERTSDQILYPVQGLASAFSALNGGRIGLEDFYGQISQIMERERVSWVESA